MHNYGLYAFRYGQFWSNIVRFDKNDIWGMEDVEHFVDYI